MRYRRRARRYEDRKVAAHAGARASRALARRTMRKRTPRMHASPLRYTRRHARRSGSFR
ncbi:hypothetical protein BMA10247_2124 [Burkholderia mallei NCTC 10247]|nr:hypothetical protein BMA10247_2124 [Burkholderia mallei NCTC 10247]